MTFSRGFGPLLALGVAAGCGPQAADDAQATPPRAASSDGSQEVPSVADAPPLPDPLVIDVTGRDYTWHLRYPGADGVQGTADDVRTVRNLHLPEGVRTVLRLHSDDFLYILRLPHLELSEIAVPDLEFSLGFASGAPGRHELRGDQMCGFAHPDLLGTLVVEPMPAFRRWLAERAAGVPDPEAVRGAQDGDGPRIDR